MMQCEKGIFPLKYSKSIALVWMIAIVLPLVLSSCKKDPRVTFIQGEWYYKDAHLANIVGESA